MHLTIFPTVNAVKLERYDFTWAEVVDRCIHPHEYSTKADCPLIKLATFGDQRSSHGALRHDANVLAVSGVECDYDEGQLSAGSAALLLTLAGITAVVYTSPSHTPAAPRWRVLAPLSTNHTPDARRELVARINGALGGKLAPESFTLSQTFYFGRVKGVVYETYQTNGTYIDLLPDLMTMYPSGKVIASTAQPVKQLTATFEQLSDLRIALAKLPADDRTEWIAVGQALFCLGDAGFELWAEWSATSAKHNPVTDLKLWNSFTGERTGFTAIFSKAQRAGWQNPRRGIDPRQAFANPGQRPEGALLQPTLTTNLKSCLVPLNSGSNPFVPHPHYVDKWIPHNEVTLLAGHGGSGKSYVALSIAVHVALGQPFGALVTTQANVLFYSAEDSRVVLGKRLAKICLALKINQGQLEGKLHMLDASDIDPALYRNKVSTALALELAELVKNLDVGLIVIDNTSDAFDGDEIKRVEVRYFIRSLRSHLARPGRAVLLLAHINKNAAKGVNDTDEDYSGSTAWNNSVRSRLSLTPDGNDAMKIKHLKANYGAKADPVRLEWHDGVPLVACGYFNVRGDSPDIAKEREEADKMALVALISDCDKREERVTTSDQGGYTAFKTLKTIVGFPEKMTKERLTGFLRELENEGRIFRRWIKTKDSKQRQVFTCAVENSPNKHFKASGTITEEGEIIKLTTEKSLSAIPPYPHEEAPHLAELPPPIPPNTKMANLAEFGGNDEFGGA